MLVCILQAFQQPWVTHQPPVQSWRTGDCLERMTGHAFLPSVSQTYTPTILDGNQMLITCQSSVYLSQKASCCTLWKHMGTADSWPRSGVLVGSLILLAVLSRSIGTELC